MEEDEERGEEDVHHGGQGSGRGAETAQSGLLETQKNQLSEYKKISRPHNVCFVPGVIHTDRLCRPLPGFPADLNNPAEVLAADVIAPGFGQSATDRLMPLSSPVFLRLDCDAEIHLRFVTLKYY